MEKGRQKKVTGEQKPLLPSHDGTIKKSQNTFRKTKKRKYKKEQNTNKYKNKINDSFLKTLQNNERRSVQQLVDTCKYRFHLSADPRQTTRANVRNILQKEDLFNLPRPIQNLKIWNLCRPETILPDGLEDILGLNLGFGINLPPSKDKLPLDFKRLRRSIRTKFLDFGFSKTDDDSFDPKLHIPKTTHISQQAPPAIEAAVNRFESNCTPAFHNSWSRPFHPNLMKQQIQLLRQLKKERKFIVVATDKNLGPAIIELDQYIDRV